MKQSLFTKTIIDRCQKLLNCKLSNEDRGTVAMLKRLLARTLDAKPQQINLVERMETKYGLAQPKKEPDIKVIYVSNPNEFPPTVIGWATPDKDDEFDVSDLCALASDFAERMKVPVPKKVFIMNKSAFFEFNKQGN